jgi:predicted DNA-binding WGR domain protein
VRHFELVDGTSNKFWEMDYAEDGTDFTVTWGRIGTAGQTQTKEFATMEKASTECAKLVAEKIKKGYSEVGVTASTPRAAKPTPRVAPTPKPSPNASPASVSEPAFSAATSTPSVPVSRTESPTDSGFVSESASASVTAGTGREQTQGEQHPGEQHQGEQRKETPNRAAENGLIWSDAMAARTWAMRGHERATHTPATRTLDAAIKSIKREANSWNSFAKTFDDATGQNSNQQLLVKATSQLIDFAEVVALMKGVPATLDLLANLDSGAAWNTWNFSLERLSRLRSLIATAPDADYEAWAEHARTLSKTAKKPKFLVFLFPTEDFSREYANSFSDMLIACSADNPPTIAPSYSFFGSASADQTAAHSIVHRFGLDAFPLLLASEPYGAEGTTTRAEILAHCGCDEAFTVLIAGIEDRHVQRALSTACQLQPHRAIRLLSPLRGKAEETARLRLSAIHHQHPGLLEEHLATATGDAARMLRSIVELASIKAVDPSTLPELLQTPPWLRKKAGAAKPIVVTKGDVKVATPPAEIVWKPGQEKNAQRATWSPFAHVRIDSESPKAKLATGILNPSEFAYMPNDLREQSLTMDAS